MTERPTGQTRSRRGRKNSLKTIDWTKTEQSYPHERKEQEDSLSKLGGECIGLLTGLIIEIVFLALVPQTFVWKRLPF